MLEKLVVERREDARLLNDLAAAYTVRAQRRGEPYDLVQALATADLAVTVDLSLLEARFNRALVLQSLFLENDARSAWRDYFQRDPASAWGREARSRLVSGGALATEGSGREPRSLLEQAVREGNAGRVREIVRREPQAVRELAELQLFGEWAEAERKGQKVEAVWTLKLLRSLGEALATVNGEHLVGDTVASIDRTAARSHPETRRYLVRGHRAFRDGYRLYLAQDNGRAAEKLAMARSALARAGSPFAARAAFYLACCVHRRSRFSQAYRMLRALESGLPADRYPALLGHIEWMKALSYSSRGRLMESVRENERAIACFERTGEKENAAAVHVMLADVLEDLGAVQKAWRHRYQTLRTMQSLRTLRNPSRPFRLAASAALLEGRPLVALYFQNEVVNRALRSAEPAELSDALLWRGLIQGRAGRKVEALADLDRAREEIKRLPDKVARQRALADAAMFEGDLILETEPGRAIDLLTFALPVYRATEHHIQALTVYRTRARAYRRLGDLKRAGQDLQAALATYDILGRDLSEGEIRLAFLAETDEVFDEMIQFQASVQKRPDLALDYAERAHTRTLPIRVSQVQASRPEETALQRAEVEPLTMEQIRDRLPAATALVQYYVVADHLFLWLIEKSGVHFWESRLTTGQIESLVAQARKVSKNREALSRLFDLLIRPWYGQVKGKTLVFVPDKELHSVPFPCLRERKTGHFLIEDHRLLVSPSGTLYLRALAREGSLDEASSGDAATLVVGNPAFDQDTFPETPLPGAEAEARQIAALYPKARLLIGREASVGRFRELAPRSRRIHFAGHAVAKQRDPLLSMLLFAPTPLSGDSGALYAREIDRLDLSGTQLVVLSACDTGTTGAPGKGVTSLARSFLGAGVPTVVASLWPVNDRVTAKLFLAFHRNLAAGEDPVNGLRDAQIAMLHDPELPVGDAASWGAFEAFGGTAH